MYKRIVLLFWTWYIVQLCWWQPYADQQYDTLINVLEKESSILIEWFNINCIQANPDTFQAIAVGKKTYATEPVLNIAWCDEGIKLLCTDHQLNFDKHIKQNCRKASQL